MRVDKITHGVHLAGEKPSADIAKRDIFTMRTEAGITIVTIRSTRSDGSSHTTRFALTSEAVDDLIAVLVETRDNYAAYPHDGDMSLIFDNGNASLAKLEPNPDYGTLMTVQEFRECRDLGAFIPDDGSGYWATATHMSDFSVWRDVEPEWATHVMWFNK